MNIDYNLYRIFLYLYEEKSISRTASKLYVSQPAISYSLKELESQLGYTLFTRSSKGIEPTFEAKELYNYISKAFNILNSAEEHISNINELTNGNIKIGISQDISINCIMDSIIKFINKYPNVHIDISYHSEEILLEMLSIHKLDLILSKKHGYANTDSIKIATQKNILAYNNKKLGPINSLKDLGKYHFILPCTGSDDRNSLDKYLDTKDIIINSQYETNSNDVCLQLIQAGIGIGYINEDSINNNDLEVIEIKDMPTTDIYIVYFNEFLTPATKKFITEK